jgi:hypothetical protein
MKERNHKEWCSLRDPLYTGECDCFRNKPGPKVLIVEPRHRSNGGKKGGQRAKKRAQAFAEVKAKPLNWGGK